MEKAPYSENQHELLMTTSLYNLMQLHLLPLETTQKQRLNLHYAHSFPWPVDAIIT